VLAPGRQGTAGQQRLERNAAARYSFLMSVPITGGAGVYKMLSVFVLGDGLPPGFAAPFFWGMVTSAVTGFIAVWGLMRLLRTRSFFPFVVYRIVLGLLVLALVGMGVLDPI